MKTPLNELLDWIKEFEDKPVPPTLTNMKEKIWQLLPKEGKINNKGQIDFNDKKDYIDLNDSINESRVDISCTKSTFYPFHVNSEKYKKLLVVQSFPEEKYFFQDKEVTCHELVNILESIEVK